MGAVDEDETGIMGGSGSGGGYLPPPGSSHPYQEAGGGALGAKVGVPFPSLPFPSLSPTFLRLTRK